MWSYIGCRLCICAEGACDDMLKLGLGVCDESDPRLWIEENGSDAGQSEICPGLGKV